MIPIADILKIQGIEPKGIVHVGAHEGEERDEYHKIFPHVLWVEANPYLAGKLQGLGEEVVNAVAWDAEVEVFFHTTENTEGSSVLEPIEHTVSDKQLRKTRPLRDFVGCGYNVLVVDVQGAELKVLEGANIEQFDLVVCEISNRQRYKDAAEPQQIASFFEEKGYRFIEGYPHNTTDGVIEDWVFAKKKIETRALILCAGTGSRWADYMGVPKYLAPVEGVPILTRTENQLKSHGVSKIIIVKKQKSVKPGIDEIDKFYGAADHWNPDGRTIILFGDTYYTDEAIKAIVEYPADDWAVFGRPSGSKLTGKPYGELYALVFHDKHSDDILANLRRAERLWLENRISRINTWTLYRLMVNLPETLLNAHVILPDYHFVEVNDMTEDFDYPHDYDRFIERKEK